MLKFMSIIASCLMEENNTSDLPETVLLHQEDREQQLEDDIVALRQEKAKTKTLFTKAKH